MFYHSRVSALALVLTILAASSTANAGQLFPPDNIGSNPNVPCPYGEVVTWHGDRVDCVNPTPGVTVSCPVGQVLTGITNGVPVCTTANRITIVDNCTPAVSGGSVRVSRWAMRQSFRKASEWRKGFA